MASFFFVVAANIRLSEALARFRLSRWFICFSTSKFFLPKTLIRSFNWLLAGEPLTFKKIVTDMRFDEVSTQYAEFGAFFVGKRVAPKEWLGGLG